MNRISKLNKNYFILEGIPISLELFEKYQKRRKAKIVTFIDDLSSLNTRTENEVLKALNQMVKSKNFFKYCSSLLININPGPNFIFDYLNLESYLKLNKNNQEINEKPHLYSFMHYVYKIMKKEDEDQAVCLMGPIGSGKTFNIIHIIEYFCYSYCPKNFEAEVFDMIHKSIQLIHIFGSIYRENNIESTSCGMLMKLGFNNDDEICLFDLDAKILDVTLPFSENGRSFSILHSFIKGANPQLRKIFEIPHNENNLAFFRKFSNNFSDNTKERFKLNDLEIWNRFHSLMKWFKFPKNDVISILQCLAFVINLNEIVISKVKVGQLKKKELFSIHKGLATKKLCKNLSIEEDFFLETIGTFKTSQEAKTFIISLMKQTYYIIFEFILVRLKDYLKSYFINLSRKASQPNPFVTKIKYINFIDFPGEVEDKTLGGFTTNLANECLLMYSSTRYYQIIEKLLSEGITLKMFKPLHSYSTIKACFGENGFFDYFSQPFTSGNFYEFIKGSEFKKHFIKCVKFNQPEDFSPPDFNFKFCFSHQQVIYNYETLYFEAKGFVENKKIFDIFSKSQNSVISFCYQMLLTNKTKDFYSFYSQTLKSLFQSIKDISPFVMYCLHSNNSYKIFFNEKGENKFSLKKKREKTKEFDEIPSEITINMMKHSLAFPLLNWVWYGYKEWIEIDDFIKEFCLDFERIKDKIVSLNNADFGKPKFQNISFKNLEKKDIVKYTMNILSREGDYIIGKNFVIMKEGTINKMKNYLNAMIKTAQQMSQNIKINKTKTKFSNVKNSRLITQRLSSKNSTPSDSNNVTIKLSDKNLSLPRIRGDLEKTEFSREDLLKRQCILNIYKNGRIINNTSPLTSLKTEKYNVFSIISKDDRNLKDENDIMNTSNDVIEEIEETIKKTKKNTVVTDPILFNKIKILMDPNKNKNYKIFDYKEITPQLIKLQTCIRGFLGRKKFKYFDFLINQIIIIQRYIRGFITRKKFAKFMKCYKKIIIIQRVYHIRFHKMVQSSIKIQKCWKRYKNNQILKDKLAQRKRASIKGEYWDSDSQDNEYNRENYNLELQLREIASHSNFSRKRIHKKLNKSQENMTDKIKKEKNPKRIVEMILCDKRLNQENKDLNYLMLDKKKLLSSSSLIQKLREDENKNEEKSENQLKNEENKKSRVTQELINKIKREEENLTFKPTINKNFNFNLKYPSNFLKRIEFYQLFKERNIENLRNHYKKKEENSFRPKVSNFANSIRNVFNRLYNEDLIRKKQQKQILKNINSTLQTHNDFYSSNKRFLEENSSNKKIENINLSEIHKPRTNETDENNLDLWPSNISKKF